MSLKGSVQFSCTACVLSLAVPLLLAAGDAHGQTPKRGGTLVFAISDDPTGINRNITSNNTDGLIACVIYQGLTRIHRSGEALPMLAKSWTVSPDATTYTFELNKADWQDGKPFTSDDVKFTLLEVSSRYGAVFAGAGRSMESIETPAPDRVVIKLKQPYGPFLASLSCQNGGAILPAHVYRGTDILKNPANANPVGLGPFLLKEWKRGDSVRLERNPNYWEKGLPYLDQIVAKIIPQSATRTNALMAGEIDYITYINVPTSDYAAIRANPRLKLTRAANPPSVDFMFFNVNRKPLNDKRVRQALLMALDRDYLVNAAYQGQGLVGTMPFTNRLTWAADEKIDYRTMYPYDPARANALLDEAGYKRGADGKRFAMNIVFPVTNTDGPLATAAFKNMWAAVGVDLTPLQFDTPAAVKRIFTDQDFDAALAQYTSFGDPALGMARAWVSTSIGIPNGNGSRYSNPEIDRMFIEAERAPTEAARGEIYKRIQRILADELPVVTLHETMFNDASSADTKGTENEGFLPSWREAWLDR